MKNSRAWAFAGLCAIIVSVCILCSATTNKVILGGALNQVTIITSDGQQTGLIIATTAQKAAFVPALTSGALCFDVTLNKLQKYSTTYGWTDIAETIQSAEMSQFSVGNPGDLAYDPLGIFFYVCIAPNTWRKFASVPW